MTIIEVYIKINIPILILDLVLMCIKYQLSTDTPIDFKLLVRIVERVTISGMV